MRSLSSQLLALFPLFALGCAGGGAPEPGSDATGPVIRVTASYPGANSLTVRDTVAAPIEQQVSGVEDMTVMESECRDDGTYTLIVRFKPKTDMAIAQVLVQNRVALAQPVLPELVQRTGIVVRKGQFDSFPPLWVAVTSPDAKYDIVYLQNFANLNVKDEIARLGGVADVRMVGTSESTLRVWLDPQKLAAHNLTAKDVVAAMEKQNMQVAAGLGQPPTPAEQMFPLTITHLVRFTSPEDLWKVFL